MIDSLAKLLNTTIYQKADFKTLFFLSHFFLFTAQQQKVDFFSSANEKIAALNEISVKTKFSIFQAPRRSENEKCGQCGRMYVAMRWCWVIRGLNVECFMLNVIWIHRKFQDVLAETLKLFLDENLFNENSAKIIKLALNFFYWINFYEFSLNFKALADI